MYVYTHSRVQVFAKSLHLFTPRGRSAIIYVGGGIEEEEEQKLLVRLGRSSLSDL